MHVFTEYFASKTTMKHILKSEEWRKYFSQAKGHTKGQSSTVLAYDHGEWLLGVLGWCNKGNVPCIGVGLMRKLVATICRCTTRGIHSEDIASACSECGRWKEVEDMMLTKASQQKKRLEIRVYAFYKTESVGSFESHQNGATNIGTNFKRFFPKPPIRETDEDLALHRISFSSVWRWMIVGIIMYARWCRWWRIPSRPLSYWDRWMCKHENKINIQNSLCSILYWSTFISQLHSTSYEEVSFFISPLCTLHQWFKNCKHVVSFMLGRIIVKFFRFSLA